MHEKNHGVLFKELCKNIAVFSMFVYSLHFQLHFFKSLLLKDNLETCFHTGAIFEAFYTQSVGAVTGLVYVLVTHRWQNLLMKILKLTFLHLLTFTA